MPNWNEILTETNGIITAPTDLIRKKYLDILHNMTKRNIICYYSGWLAKPNANHISISDIDMEGFMNAVRGLDCSKGLDLFLHTPGGDVAATEAIVKYLRSKFGTDIRVFVPQLALSAGTLIACASKEIIMGNQSSLGPIDPQIGGIAALDVLREYEEFEADIIQNPYKAHYWSIRLQGVPPTFINKCKDAVSLSTELATNWLKTGMFEDEAMDTGRIDSIVGKLNEKLNSKTHGRHFDKVYCKRIGLKIVDLEDKNGFKENVFQDVVLSIHHAYCISLTNTAAVKIIENHNGARILRFA